MELTILMPCLNEAETIGVCIKKAMGFLERNSIEGEVLISDNGSTDDSRQIAESLGARVINAPIRGYGGALITGCQQAMGKYVIMGDADDSYDFEHLMPFVEKLREGYDLVMGNRFEGGIEKDAMPWSHRYIGNPVLSFIGRLFFKSEIRDFHCGLRGFNRESILALGLRTTGMEYASEMVVMSELNGYKIAEVPTTLKKDGRSRPPHLRSLRDGWRHLKFLLMYAPNWLLLYPGIVFLVVSLVLGIALVVNSITINQVNFSIHTLLYCACAVIVSVNILSMYAIVKTYALKQNFIPVKSKTKDSKNDSAEDGVIFGGCFLALAGIVLSVLVIWLWISHGLGNLNPEQTMRIVIPAVLCLIVGFQLICTGFVIGIIKVKTTRN